MPKAEENTTEVFLELIGTGEGVSRGSRGTETGARSQDGRGTEKRQPARVRSHFILVGGAAPGQPNRARQRRKCLCDRGWQAWRWAGRCVCSSPRQGPLPLPAGGWEQRHPVSHFGKQLGAAPTTGVEGTRKTPSCLVTWTAPAVGGKSRIHFEGCWEFDFPGKTWPAFLLDPGGASVPPFPSLVFSF